MTPAQQYKERMVLKILEDNRILKEECDKTKLTLKSKVKLLAQNEQASNVRVPLKPMTALHSRKPSPQSKNNKGLHGSPKASKSHHLDQEDYGLKKQQTKLSLTGLFPSKAGSRAPSLAELPKVELQRTNTTGRKDSQGDSVIDRSPLVSSPTFKSEIENQRNNKFRVISPKRNLLKVGEMDKDGKQNLFAMNENSLSSLIFAELEVSPEANSEEKELEKLLLKNQYLAMLSNLLSSKSSFVRIILQLSESNAINLYENLCQLYFEVSQLLRGARRIRSIFDTAPIITASMSVEDVMKTLVDFICECLDCERATVFAVDRVNQELWSKVAKGSTITIKIPLHKGVAGYVATTANALNIRDAYKDERFDPSNDQRTGYKTKTILTVPMFNGEGEVDGVLQAINKHADPNGNPRYFDRNDMGLLEMVANLASSSVNNTIQYNQQIMIMNNLRIILRAMARLFGVKSDQDFVTRTKELLQYLFNTQSAGVFIRDQSMEDRLYTYDKDGIKQTYEATGLVGECIRAKELVSVHNSSEDLRYNGLIDIDTTMTLLSVPLVEVKTNTVYGAFQIIYARGLDGFMTITKSNLSAGDVEVLDYVSMQLTQCIKSLLNIED